VARPAESRHGLAERRSPDADGPSSREVCVRCLYGATPSTSGGSLRAMTSPTGRPPGSPSDPTSDQRAAGALRTAKRMAARVASPRLERNAAFDFLCLADLRIARGVVDDEQIRVSHWRRIIQARLRVVRGRMPARGPVADFRLVLTDARATEHRLALVAGGPVTGASTLPDLAEVWWRKVELSNVVEMDRLELDLGMAEGELSTYFIALRHRRDQINNEIIVRYREEPRLALSLLPPEIPPRVAAPPDFPRTPLQLPGPRHQAPEGAYLDGRDPPP
jgi:hypothetical protein